MKPARLPSNLLTVSPLILSFIYVFTTTPLFSQERLFTEHPIDIIGNSYTASGVADFNGDDRLDLLVCNGTDRFDWYENTEDQGFVGHNIAGNVGTFGRLTCFDFDADGDTDILFSRYSQVNELSWWENDGEANFEQHVIERDFGWYHAISPCDWDEDGDIDLMVGVYNNRAGCYWYENDGQNRFSRRVLREDIIQAFSINPCDIENDGDLDALIFTDDQQGKAYLLRNDGNRQFSAIRIPDINRNALPLIADIDRDGDLDFIAFGLAYIFNDEDQFEIQDIIDFQRGCRSSLLYDFDLDGYDDLVTASFWGDGAKYWPGIDMMEFGQGIVLLDEGVTAVLELGMGDFNNDGMVDFVAGGMNQNNGRTFFSWFEMNKPILEWAANEHDFGDVPFMTEASWELEIENSGLVEARISLSSVDDPAFSIIPEEGVIIPSGESRSLEIVFTPTEGRDYAATMVFESNTVERLTEIALSGIGITTRGTLQGSVLDLATNRPIAHARIELVPNLAETTTDEAGRFILEEIPAISYSVKCTHDDYLTWQIDDLIIEDEQEMTIEIEMSYATFTPSFQSYRRVLPSQATETRVLHIHNDGNGPLTWTGEILFEEDEQIDPWSLRESASLEGVLQDNRLQGIVFANDCYYIAGARGDSPSAIYVLDRNWDLIHTFDQIGQSRYGYRDLDFDGEILWATDDENAVGLTLEGEELITFETHINPANAIAWDESRNCLWVASTTSDIKQFDRQGNQLDVILRRRDDWRIYGLASHPRDNDDCSLYIIGSIPEIGHVVYKMNPDQPESFILVTALPEVQESLPGGGFITFEWDPYHWVMMTIPNNDEANIWEIAPNDSWLNVSNLEGSLDPRESMEIEITLDTGYLCSGHTMNGSIRFESDGRNGDWSLPLELGIEDRAEGQDSEIEIQLYSRWNLISSPVQPAEPSMRSIWQNMAASGALGIVKNQDGKFYAPALDFANIPDWDARFGYAVKMVVPTRLSIRGSRLETSTPIPLRMGWSIVSYLPEQNLLPGEAFVECAQDIVLVKDVDGRFYAPRYHISSLPRLRCGVGYMVLARRETDLIWGGGNLDASLPNYDYRWLPGVHYVMPDPSGSDMSIIAYLGQNLLEVFRNQNASQNEIGIFNANNRCIGSVSIIPQSAVNLDKLTMIVRGDDPTTTGIDGAIENDTLVFRFWQDGIESNLIAEVRTGDRTYRRDGFAVLDLNLEDGGDGNVPEEFGISSVFPNPFNSSTTIEFATSLDASSTRLTVHDLVGREVANLLSESSDSPPRSNSEIKTASRSGTMVKSIVWDASDQPAGIYFLHLEQGSRIATMKLVLLR